MGEPLGVTRGRCPVVPPPAHRPSICPSESLSLSLGLFRTPCRLQRLRFRAGGGLRPAVPGGWGCTAPAQFSGEAGLRGRHRGQSGQPQRQRRAAGRHSRGVRAWGLGGPWEEPAQRLSEYNTNQCNNTSQCNATTQCNATNRCNNVAAAWLPAVRLRGGRLVGGNSCKRQPEFV